MVAEKHYNATLHQSKDNQTSLQYTTQLNNTIGTHYPWTNIVDVVPEKSIKTSINSVYSSSSSIPTIATENFDSTRQMKKDKVDAFLKSYDKKTKQSTKLSHYSFITKKPDTMRSLTIHRILVCKCNCRHTK